MRHVNGSSADISLTEVSQEVNVSDMASNIECNDSEITTDLREVANIIDNPNSNSSGSVGDHRQSPVPAQPPQPVKRTPTSKPWSSQQRKKLKKQTLTQ